MKVILLKDVESLGKMGEIKEVTNGYARNFLIPEKLAEAATAQTIKRVEALKKAETKKAEENLKTTEELAAKLDGLVIKISVKANENGQLFGSVTSKMIAEALKEKEFDIEETRIAIDPPIKEVGEYPITINLDHNLEAAITAVIEAKN